MVQAYRFKKHLAGRFAVVIAVCDAGVGIRRSLENKPDQPSTDIVGAFTSLETAAVTNESPFSASGDVGGLRGMGRRVHRLGGKLSVRSGTARLAYVPSWDDDVPRREHLAPFPGMQLQITLHE